jgi:hypothetical protein
MTAQKKANNNRSDITAPFLGVARSAGFTAGG